MEKEKMLTPADINFPFVVRKKCGRFSEVTHLQSMNDKTRPPRKFDKDNFVNDDGELIPIKKHSEVRSENKQSLANTFRNLRDLINCNCNPTCSLWVTLTYKENMTDTAQLSYDFDVFMKRLQRFCEKSENGKCKYIAVAEPQARGAWHWHIILMFARINPYISNADMARIWEHGFTKTKAFKDIDNIGAYLTAYLTDCDISQIPEKYLAAMPDPEIKEVKTENGIKKSIVKGGRLHMYPRYFNLFRSSKGLKRPEKDIFKVIGNGVSPESLYAKPIYFENLEDLLSFLGKPTYQLEKTVHFTDGQSKIVKTFYKLDPIKK